MNFWGGVWKRFLVYGPLKLAIRVSKNYSFNTILQGAFLDPLAEHPAPYYFGHRAWRIQEARRREARTRLVAAWRSGRLSYDPNVGKTESANLIGLALARRIMAILGILEHRNPAAWAANQRQAYLSVLRCCVANYGPIPKNTAAAKIAEKCYYRLGLFRHWEAVEESCHILTSRQIEKALPDISYPYAATAIREYLAKLGRTCLAPTTN